MLIVSVFSQVFNTTYYSIVDAMLLDAHVMRNRLAASMDVNDFVHVNCAYHPRASGSGSRSSIVPVPVGVASSSAPLSQASASILMPPPALTILENPSTTPSTRPSSARLAPHVADVDVTDYLNQRSPLEGSGFEDQLNQYGSNISHGEGGSPSSDQHWCTPRWECSSPPHPQPTPSQPLAGAGEVHSLSEGVSLESQPVVASSTVQDMDVDTVLTSPSPHTHAAMDDRNQPPLDEIALVEQTFTERVLINCSDISSCGLPRPLLGESTDGDSDQDKRGVDQGVTLPAAEDLQRPESVLIARPPADDQSRPIATNAGADVHAPVEDEFYNAAGKAPHPDSVIPKVESGWWKNREMRKKRKAEERAKAELELQKMREDAARLAKQNANLQRELNLARLSLSGASDPPIPSTSAASVGGLHGQGVSTTDRGICSSRGGVLGSLPPVVAEFVVPLRPCGMHSTTVGSGDYPRPEDNPFPSEIEGAEDSLQFHIETDLSTTNPTHDILLPSLDTAAAPVVEEGGIAQLRGQAEVEKSGDEEGNDDEEESEEVKGDDEEVEADDEEEQDDEGEQVD